MTTVEQIDDFAEFAKHQLVSGHDHSIDELYDQWRRLAFRDTDAQAVQASLRDLENGERGQPVDEFLAEFDNQRTPGQQ